MWVNESAPLPSPIGSPTFISKDKNKFTMKNFSICDDVQLYKE